MRIFNNEFLWDAENQEWVEVYKIDGNVVSKDIFYEQLKVEELATEDDCDDMVESNLCKCCQCEENDNCNDYECTCGELECENDGEDEDWVVEDELCQCVYCKSARGEFSEEEEYEIGLVEYYADLVEKNRCTCGAEMRNILYSFLQEGY